MNPTENNRIFKAISRAIQSFNEQLPPARKLPASPDCQLVGAPDLDSAELVNLLVAIEQEVERDLGVSVTLFDAIEQFVNVQAVVDFIAARIRGGEAQVA